MALIFLFYRFLTLRATNQLSYAIILFSEIMWNTIIYMCITIYQLLYTILFNIYICICILYTYSIYIYFFPASRESLFHFPRYSFLRCLWCLLNAGRYYFLWHVIPKSYYTLVLSVVYTKNRKRTHHNILWSPAIYVYCGLGDTVSTSLHLT